MMKRRKRMLSQKRFKQNNKKVQKRVTNSMNWEKLNKRSKFKNMERNISRSRKKNKFKKILKKLKNSSKKRNIKTNKKKVLIMKRSLRNLERFRATYPLSNTLLNLITYRKAMLSVM